MPKPIHTFGAGLGVTNRSPNSFGQPRKQHVFGIEEGFRPKAATNIWCDHANLLSRQTIKRTELITNRMRTLTRLPMSKPTHSIGSCFFPTTGGDSSFERARCNALINDSLAHHHIALREVGDLTGFKIDNGVRSKIGEQQSFVSKCFFGINHRVQRVVVDKNLFGRVDCLSPRFGDNSRNQFADIAHGAIGQSRAPNTSGQQRHINGNKVETIGL